jgi:ribosomal-protein-alanine N-acetyltransferase
MDSLDNFIFFAPLVTRRLVIKELTMNDAFSYFQFASNPEVARYMSWNAYKDIEESKTLIMKTNLEYHRHKIYNLGIYHKEHGKLIGTIGFSRRNLSDVTCEVWYALAYEYWHQGLMVEALEAFCTYLIEGGKKIIIATHIKENVNSGRVMVKAGFQRDPSYDGPYMIKGREEILIGYSIKM